MCQFLFDTLRILLQNSSTRIKVVLLENTKDTPYYDLATDKLHIVQSYIFELKRLGDENSFDFGAYQRHVQTIQQCICQHMKN